MLHTKLPTCIDLSSQNHGITLRVGKN